MCKWFFISFFILMQITVANGQALIMDTCKLSETPSFSNYTDVLKTSTGNKRVTFECALTKGEVTVIDGIEIDFTGYRWTLNELILRNEMTLSYYLIRLIYWDVAKPRKKYIADYNSSWGTFEFDRANNGTPLKIGAQIEIISFESFTLINQFEFD